MKAAEHRTIAERIERSLTKCRPDDYEMKIEAAMLAATHRLNEALHRQGVTQSGDDVMHTYLLTVNQYRRISVVAEPIIGALSAIEDLRAPFVRGNAAGGEAAADRALALLGVLRAAADESQTQTGSQAASS